MDRGKWGDDQSTNMLAENLTGTCALGVFGFENELMGLACAWAETRASIRSTSKPELGANRTLGLYRSMYGLV